MALHITSGDYCGELIGKSGVAENVFVWHDILYDGPREPGWPSDEILEKRADFLTDTTGGGLTKELVLKTLKHQYDVIKDAGKYDQLVLWFDACLFDQSMLAHILNCLAIQKIQNVELLCVDHFSGVEPYNGLGELTSEQLASVYDQRCKVSQEQFEFAKQVDDAFAIQDLEAFKTLSNLANAPLSWVPAAVKRWLQEQPDPETGFGRLEQLALDAIRRGISNPVALFADVAERDSNPQYWGDTTLWEKVNGLAEQQLIKIDGPQTKLPQWESQLDLNDFKITPV